VGRETSSNGGKLMTRDEILAAAKRKRIESHEVPELGGAVFFAVMGGVDRDRWDEEVNAEIDASKAVFCANTSLSDQSILASTSATSGCGYHTGCSLPNPMAIPIVSYNGLRT
jgi:hypothetical protein